MKLYLFLIDRLLTFKLPSNVSGSYSFDEVDTEDEKLINVESRNGQWVLYSAGDNSIILNGNSVTEIPLQNNNFYQLRRGNKNYLLYVESNFSTQFLTYTYDKSLNIVIGNDTNCNVKYNSGLIKGIVGNICFEGDNIIFNNKGTSQLYINDLAISSGKYYLRYGDIINIYGLKIMILKNYILINNPQNSVQIDSNTNLKHYQFEVQNPTSIEIKDRELYGKDDYFSKAPRIRRLIETKQIELSESPKMDNSGEMPLLLTIGPMITMGLTSAITLVSVLSQIHNGSTTWAQSWSSILISVSMLLSMLLWPIVTNMYNKKRKNRLERETKEKYINYLEGKKKELAQEVEIQKSILNENLITTAECLKIIKNKTINFWDKRIDQSDFLVTRIGIGNQLLDVDIKYPEKGFTIDEDELRKRVDDMAEEYKYIVNVPLGYSFYENRITAIMGSKKRAKMFVDNMLLQLLSFYSYDDLKIVLFTNEQNESKWDYIKYLNHNFTNDKSIRLFANNSESSKVLCSYLMSELNFRLDVKEQGEIKKPYYLIVTDDYDQIKRDDFITELCEASGNPGFSFVILENRLSNLPSKCNNFINIGDNSSSILKNSFEKQEKIDFKDEIVTGIDMMELSKILSNVPIELEEELKQLPESITFIEMEKIGKVKQLNILNRWNTNDSTKSLKAEVGVGDQGELMYLDLHEKAHGPHGLIAGMTGSGKSEFIITYILSMAVNYSPDDVAFILIDYKGGGLAFAFENQTNGIVLPHLAGTITNLDKAEMERMLTSIDSEVKRRQKMFNEARDVLGESTIDIYKYQKFFKEGRLSEAIPHLFIVCDEFAELKDQQPEFMDNLISIARIGRSLGIHLILATQKPSGVVNDQIWSNAKFHVCLKVQDANDSNEMLKKPDAANLKQTGRFYLQVGYDEYFALGQSAWCGARYYPSDVPIKNVDKSINFINDIGYIIKSIQASSNKKIEDNGDQLSAIMNTVIEVANETGKKARRLWLENIPDVILIDSLVNKYSLKYDSSNIVAIIGEYDAPELQVQNVLMYDLLNQGNTAIYSTDGSESELLIESIIYSTITKYSSTLLNYYIVDYGSQTLRKYEKAPHVGGVVLLGEDEKYRNLFKLVKNEIKRRKKILSDFGGDFKSYQAKNPGKLPVMTIILNNYDSIDENDKKLFEELPEVIRDSERYGIIFIISATGISSIPRKVSQSINNIYALKLKDPMDYGSLFTSKKKLVPRDIFGRGIYQDGEILHEFQTASIVSDKNILNESLNMVITKLNELNQVKAQLIPTLPDKVTFDLIQGNIKDITSIPIGVNKNTLEVETYNFTNYLETVISANKLRYTKNFMLSLIEVLKKEEHSSLVVLDPTKELSSKCVSPINYCSDNFAEYIEKINNFLEKQVELKSDASIYIIIYGLSKFIDKLNNQELLENMVKLCKKLNKASIILLDDVNKIKNYAYEDWFQPNVGSGDGIFIGKGAGEQTTIKIANYNAELSSEYPNDIAFKIEEGSYSIFKTIDFEGDDK